MRYISAYLLATLGGNQSPSAADIEKILKAGGVEVDSSAVEKLLAELSGKDINALVAEGSSKLASMPAGGSAVASAPAAAAAGGAAAPSKKEEKKVEEEVEEDMGFGLFD